MLCPTPSLDRCRIRSPTTSIDRKLVFPPCSCINRHVTGTSQTNKRRNIAERSALPAAFIGVVPVSISILAVAFEQVSARPNLDSPLVLAPSVGVFWNDYLCRETQIPVNYVKKHTHTQIKYGVNKWNDWFWPLFFHHFTPVSNHVKQYVFNKCSITKYKHLKNKNTNANVRIPHPAGKFKRWTFYYTCILT